MSNETTVNTAAQQEHMPDYNRTLGFWDLFFIAVGIIIGSGVLVFTGRGIAQTGRSVCLAYLGAAVWVVCTAIPTFLMCSCIRLIGGAYTQCNLFLGEKWGGFYLCLYFLSQMGLNLYAQTFGLYFCELFGGGNEKLIAAIMITFFYILNFFGVELHVQSTRNLMSIILLLALIWFTVRGLPRVDWANFFGGEGWMTNGWGGLFATSTLLTYSLMGATSLMPYSAQAKNPQRDIPLAGAISTFSIAILFALMGIVCSGILPLDQVANQTLGVIANHFLTKARVHLLHGRRRAVRGCRRPQRPHRLGLPSRIVMYSHDGWLPKKPRRPASQVQDPLQVPDGLLCHHHGAPLPGC